MTLRTRTPLVILVAGALLAALAAWATSESPFINGPASTVLVIASVGLPFAVAAELRARYPDRIFAWLLIAIGSAYFVRSLAALNSPDTYGPSRAIGVFSDVLIVWLVLAFPSGKLPRPWSRAITIAGALSIVLLWWPVVLTSVQIPAGGFFVACGRSCPRNSLLLASSPGTSDALDASFRCVAALVALATVGVLAARLRGASSVMRRILAPVLLATIARLAAVSVYFAVGSTAAVRALLIASYLAVPVAIVVGLLRGRSYDAAALERLVRGLRTRPGPDELRSVMAKALQDPTLEIAYWLAPSGSYARADGSVVSLAASGERRAVTRVAGPGGQPVAALVHDPALLDHPRLLEALASTASLALESNRLETEVTAARAGTITAVDAERRRIERDLHDGTQQRLIALRMKLSVAERILGADAGRAKAVLDELGGDIESALHEVRQVSHGIAPPILLARGLTDALAAVASRAPLNVSVHADGVARYSPQIETAVYFCCLEALQNVEKHAGSGASAEIDLRCDGDALAFVVRDDGGGFDPDMALAGMGLRNIRARVQELGGTAHIAPRAGGGTEVQGAVPAVPAAG